MQYFPPALENLVEQFARLPGVGVKSAQRLAFHVLNMPKERAEDFARCILEAREKIHKCAVCQNLTDEELCPICRDESRDHTTICVVENSQDVLAFERTREYKGVYHVLGGIGPDQLALKELLRRVAEGEVREVIMATNPTVEGEATAMYIARLLKPMGIKVSRLAYGIPVGGNLEYADETTLFRALQGRSEI